MRAICLIFLLAGLFLAGTLRGADVESPHPKIYDEQADGTQQIDEALALAKKTQQRVLLQFGANWCGWCHLLHQAFVSDPEVAGALKGGYIVVYLDVNRDHNRVVDEKYGKPTRLGLPVLVVLNADGRQLTTKDTGQLEEGKSYNSRKILEFLATEEWPDQRPPTPALGGIIEFRKRALEHIKKELHDLKADTLIFDGLTYGYRPTEELFSEDIYISFIDPATRAEGVENGRKTITHELIGVQIVRDLEGAEKIFVHPGGRSTKYQ